MKYDLVKVREDLIVHEGKRSLLYNCSAGYPTIGVGHNCETKPLSQAAIHQILNDDIDDCIGDLDRNIERWRRYPQGVQHALINMTFNMGISGLMKFRQTFAYLDKGHWIAAADEMLDSKWADQVGNRAEEVSSWVRDCADE